LLVLIFEEFTVEPKQELAKVCAFLQIDLSDAILSEPDTPKTKNSHRMPRNELCRRMLGSSHVRHAARSVVPQSLRTRAYESFFKPSPKPVISQDVIGDLTSLYAADTAQVERLLGRSLPWRTAQQRPRP
jgi:hypothetical protein